MSKVKMSHKIAKKIRKSLKEQTGLDFRHLTVSYKAGKSAIKNGTMTL